MIMIGWPGFRTAGIAFAFCWRRSLRSPQLFDGNQLMDLIIRNASLSQQGESRVADIGIANGTIVTIEASLQADAPERDAESCLVVAGLIETHIHLDKTCILDRCRIQEGTVAEAVRETAAAKRSFTVEGAYDRGKR